MIWKFCRAAVVLAWGSVGVSMADAETIRIAVIDPFSGPAALQGEMGSRHIQMAVDDINAHGSVLGGTKLELVSLDNKSSPQESLVALKQAIDQGIRYVTQGNGSHVGHALTEGVLKHNQRNPGQEVLYLNHAAIDPALTNEKCNYWHFRFDANVDMKIDALTGVIAKALEDMRYDAGVGEAWMRADDHQIMEPLFVATFAKVGKQSVKYDADDTGYGWRVDTRIEAKDNILPTTCKMERP